MRKKIEFRIVGSNAVHRDEFPDYSIIAGAPAKIAKRYNFDAGRRESR
jgi:acetyltransferase-like isoleucine patch superfamily enzyme